eukprot:527791-Pelagomonas_calceolata.AAC.8
MHRRQPPGSMSTSALTTALTFCSLCTRCMRSAITMVVIKTLCVFITTRLFDTVPQMNFYEQHSPARMHGYAVVMSITLQITLHAFITMRLTKKASQKQKVSTTFEIHLQYLVSELLVGGSAPINLLGNCGLELRKRSGKEITALSCKRGQERKSLPLQKRSGKEIPSAAKEVRKGSPFRCKRGQEKNSLLPLLRWAVKVNTEQLKLQYIHFCEKRLQEIVKHNRGNAVPLNTTKARRSRGLSRPEKCH